MADHSAIEWTDATFNPWIGCTKVSPACDHCYAAVSTPARTLGIEWGAGLPRRRTSVGNWKLPMRWEREHEAFYSKHGRRRRVFCASLADVFDNEIDPLWRRDLFALIQATPNLDWLLLTKRVGNVVRMIEDQKLKHARHYGEWAFAEAWLDGRPPANVWIGATIASQDEADRDIPKLLALPAQVRFLSMEPLLGSVDLTDIDDGAAHREIPREYWTIVDNDDSPPAIGIDALSGDRWQRFGAWSERGPSVDWVIAGGESGIGARPMHPVWARSLRDQCAEANVPFFFKQWGEWAPIDSWEPCGRMPQTAIRADGSRMPAEEWHVDGQRLKRIGKRPAGRLLDGVNHSAYPEVNRG